MKRIPLIIIFLNVLCQTIQAKKKEDDSLFNSLTSLLNNYTRPFTFLELYSKSGNLSRAIAQNYNCACVITPVKSATTIVSAFKNTNPDNVIVLDAVLSTQDIVHLGECEHFDITYAPKFIFNDNDEWQETVDAILTLGDYSIIQTPDKKTNNILVEHYLQHCGGIKIERQSHSKENPLYLFYMTKTAILKRRWQYTGPCRLGEYTIESTFSEKKLIKHKTKPAGHTVTPWHPGINLYTFKKLHGIYPTKETIRSLLIPLDTITHNDLRIFNLIIQGNNLVPIDCNEKGRKNIAKELLPAILNHFRTKNMPLSDLYALPCQELQELDEALTNHPADF